MNRFNDYPLLCGTDTSSGVAKEINRKLLELSKFKELPYGNDKFTELATKKFRKVFNQKNIEFLPMISGTASNALALSLMSKKVDNIICHKEAHILTSECGAPEFFNSGIKLLGFKTDDGKLCPEKISHYLENEKNIKIGGISVSQLSENGTSYSIEDLKKIGKICKKYNLFYHMDGARFTNSLYNLGVRPDEMTWKIGLDCLSLGATKNGALAAEAIIFFNKIKLKDLKFYQKRSGHIIAKTQFISSQFLAWFENELWLKLAKKSNDTAKSFENYLQKNKKNFEILFSVDGNEVFVKVKNKDYQAIKNYNIFPKLWSNENKKFVILRFVFSFDFSKKDFNNLVNRLEMVK